ncbi:MAG: hypothetical protein H6737_19240 [Alphaproteobacteria bacterium]|nr:hypothetical protein [Alphaproteobacteria bacterium]
MNGMGAFAPRWEGGALALSVHDGLRPRGPNVFVYPDRIEVNGERLPHEAVRDVRLATTNGRPRRHVLDVYVAPGVLKAAGLPVPELGNAMFSDKGVRVPLLDAQLGDVHELIRVLELWRDDEAVRVAWGTADVEPLLVPRFDERLLAETGAHLTAAGVEIPCAPPLDGLALAGCSMVLLYPLLGLGSCVAGMTWTPTGTGATGTFTDPTFLVLWILLGVFMGFVWTGVRRLAPVEPGWLRIGQSGLTLPEGTVVPFEALSVVHGANRILRIRTATKTYKVFDLKGDATRLAAAIDALRRAPGEAPAEIEKLRGRRATALE